MSLRVLRSSSIAFELWLKISLFAMLLVCNACSNSGGNSGNTGNAGEGNSASTAAPTNLAATAGNQQANLTWRASSGATSYYVKRGTVSGGPYTTVGTPTATTYADTKLTNGTAYYYVVTAVGVAGESADSNQASATPTAAPAAPVPPLNLTATGGNQQVSLAWTASTGATSYNVKRASTNGGPYTTVGTPAGTSYTDTAVTNGTAYYYVVTAVNAAGQSGNSNQATATPMAAPTAPAPPLNLTATGGNQQVSLAWTASTGASSYHFKRAATNGGPYTTVASPAGTSYTDTSVTNGTTYYYVVTAVSSNGESANSNQASATPTAPGTSSCALPISAVKTAGNTNVVGDGTPASCTESAFEEAVAAGGVVTFNCGAAPYRLVLSSTKSITQDTVIDGGNLVTLDGGGQVRQLLLNNGNFDATTPTLTLQNVTFANGHGTDNAGTGAPTGGGAIYRYGGTLNVINSQFINNVGPASGQDSAGGAIYSVGVGTTTIVGSTFNGNQSSDGGALGNLGASIDLVNDTITGNQATGSGGNPGDGGNGGGIYMDGAHISIKMCGTHVDTNKGNAYGGGFFFVDDATAGTAAIDQSSFNGNSAAFAGGLYLQGAAGTLTNSSVINNQVEAIDGVGPYAPNAFFDADSLGSLSSDNIAP
jgi:fibronectin type 3 domain-containing protein